MDSGSLSQTQLQRTDLLNTELVSGHSVIVLNSVRLTGDNYSSDVTEESLVGDRDRHSLYFLTCCPCLAGPAASQRLGWKSPKIHLAGMSG